MVLMRTKQQTLPELRELQRRAAAVIMRKLDRSGLTQKTWTDGRRTADVVSEFIKPNDRLTSFERIQIYNRQYWFRLLDCLYDDFPGLHAILGDRRFEKLRIAYLTQYPSESFTLRNLGARLEAFLRDEPKWIKPRVAMCLDMVRFEWAQILGFDEAQLPPVTADDLLGKDPASLRLSLQPYISVLELGYPLDDFVLAVKKRNASLRGEASNAIEDDRKEKRIRKVPLPKAQATYLAVHRLDNVLYYKRLNAAQYRLLRALQSGETLASACGAALTGEDDESIAGQIHGWFQTWMELGWFCRRK